MAGPNGGARRGSGIRRQRRPVSARQNTGVTVSVTVAEELILTVASQISLLPHICVGVNRDPQRPAAPAPSWRHPRTVHLWAFSSPQSTPSAPLARMSLPLHTAAGPPKHQAMKTRGLAIAGVFGALLALAASVIVPLRFSRSYAASEIIQDSACEVDEVLGQWAPNVAFVHGLTAPAAAAAVAAAPPPGAARAQALPVARAC